MQSLPHEGELDFYETNCHWRGCGLEFDTQDDLVRVCRCFVQASDYVVLRGMHNFESSPEFAHFC